MFDVSLKHPMTVMIIGSSGSGKTTWVFNMLKEAHLLFSSLPDQTFFFYKYWQNIYEDMLQHNLVDKFIQGIPSLDTLRNLVRPNVSNGGTLLIFDDALQNAGDISEQLFTEIAHHMKTSVIWLSQKLFLENSQYRTMSLNSNYIVLLKNTRDSRQIVTFASQVRPYRSSAIVEAFRKATELPFSYMLFDFNQSQSDAVRLRSHIFTHEHPMRAYILNS